jgi:hypothetical protein
MLILPCPLRALLGGMLRRLRKWREL